MVLLNEYEALFTPRLTEDVKVVSLLFVTSTENNGLFCGFTPTTTTVPEYGEIVHVP